MPWPWSFPPQWLAMIPPDKQAPLIASLAQDPRPGYQDDPAIRYGFEYAGFDVRFHVRDGVLIVCQVVALENLPGC